MHARTYARTNARTDTLVGVIDGVARPTVDGVDTLVRAVRVLAGLVAGTHAPGRTLVDV